MFVRILLSLLIASGLALPARAAEIHLSAASSLTDAVRELAKAYESRNPGVRILANFASSGVLARQVAQGAPADLFISAHPGWMAYLVEGGRVPAGEVRTLARNSLVLVGQPGTAVPTLADAARLRRIAVGSPRSVPAGQYAEQALRAAGLYEELAGRLVMAKDVRQALVYADRGEVEGAFVYRTDARLAREAVILLAVPEHLHDPVTYPAGLTAEGSAKPEAVAFFEFLGAGEAADILERHGFVVP